MPKLPREQVAAKLNPVLRCMKETSEKLQREMLDAEVLESTDPDVLMALSERLVDTVAAANDSANDLYHWLHQISGRTPGLSRPMSL